MSIFDGGRSIEDIAFAISLVILTSTSLLTTLLAYENKLMSSEMPISKRWFLKRTSSIPLSYIKLATVFSKLTPSFSLLSQFFSVES